MGLIDFDEYFVDIVLIVVIGDCVLCCFIIGVGIG